MATDREKEKAELRHAIAVQVMEPKEVTKKYTAAVYNKDVVLSTDKDLPVSIERGFDNLLRNFAYHEDKTPSERLNAFLRLEEVRRILNDTRYTQRPILEDVASIRWHYSQGNISKLRACKLLIQLRPGKVSPEVKEYVKQRDFEFYEKIYDENDEIKKAA